MAKSFVETRALREQYCSFMEEIKARRNLVYAAAHDEFNLPRLASYEFCVLQLRYISELIGLGCLAAHGDISATRSKHHLQKPGQIIAELETLKSDFFPAPGEAIVGPSAQVMGLRPIENDALTKEELKSLYDSCGAILHRGSLKHLRPHKVDFERVKRWDSKIVHLLNFHYIRLAEPRHHLWVRMMAKERNDKVVVQLVRTTWVGLGREPLRGTAR